MKDTEEVNKNTIASRKFRAKLDSEESAEIRGVNAPVELHDALKKKFRQIIKIQRLIGNSMNIEI